MWLALNRVLSSTFVLPAELPLGGRVPTSDPPSDVTGAEEPPTDTGSVPMKRVWAMPNRWTFKIKPIKELLEKYHVAEDWWVDPFAGFNSPAKVTNDLNPESPATFHLPAHEFLQKMRDDIKEFDGCLFDPPYSIHQVKVAYDSFGLSLKDNITGGFPKEKDLISQLVRPGGIVISFGWNTVGMGKKRGFEAVEYLAISHGGNRNDTLVTVERRL